MTNYEALMERNKRRSGRPIDKENDTPEKQKHRRNYAARMKKKRESMPKLPPVSSGRSQSYQARLAIAQDNLLKLNPPLGWESRNR